MTQPYTLRPREKIVSRTAGALSDHELLQALIGAGTRQISASRIARSILKELRRNKGALSYEQLRSIPGLGTAYAARILAAFELARRWSYLKLPSEPPVSLQSSLRLQLNAEKTVFSFDLYDAAGGFIERQDMLLHASIDQASVIRRVVSRALAQQASIVDVGIAGERHVRLIYMSDSVYCRTIQRTLEAIGVRLRQFTTITSESMSQLI